MLNCAGARWISSRRHQTRYVFVGKEKEHDAKVSDRNKPVSVHVEAMGFVEIARSDGHAVRDGLACLLFRTHHHQAACLPQVASVERQTAKPLNEE
jgi:hypothetical protein